MHHLWECAWTGYDPAVPQRAWLPAGLFDLVICTDVLEHIPEDDLRGWVIDELFGKARRGVFIAVPTFVIEEKLPNGEYTHCTARPREWWLPLLQDAATRHNVKLVAMIKDDPRHDPRIT